jgi:plastocyanin
MAPNPDPTETDESIEQLLGVGRRPLLRALGAGAALSLGGVAAADEHEDDGDADDADADADDIDPVFGYPTTDAEDLPDGLDPDHEVELLVAPPSGPGQPPFLYFDPAGLHLETDDVVQFTAVSPDHTVTAYHEGIGFDESRTPDDAEPFSSPVIGPGAAWLYRFEHEGVYDVYCGPHQILGMVMRLVVGDIDEEDLPEYADSVEGVPSAEQLEAGLNELSEANEDCEWPYVMPAEVLGSDALNPTCIQEAGEVPFSDVAEDLGYDFQAPEGPPEPHGEDDEINQADNETVSGDDEMDHDGNESTDENGEDY